MKLLEKIKNFFFKKKQELHLSKEDLEVFAKTLNDPPNPNYKLKRAVRNYNLATKFNDDKVRLKLFIEPHIINQQILHIIIVIMYLLRENVLCVLEY